MAEIVRVIGYHGTSKAAASEILRDTFRLSRNDYDWLGDGVYFWQDAPMRAWEWATSVHGNDAAVIAARVRIEDFIDLLDIQWSSVLAEAHDAYIEKCRQEHSDLPRQTTGAHRLDRAVINYLVGVLAEDGITVRGVRASFSEGRRIFPNSALFNRAHVQMAVRDLGVVEEVWAVSEGERGELC